MKSKFRHVALFGKYHATVTGGALESSRKVLDDVAQFLAHQGCEVVLDKDTAVHTGLNAYPALSMDQIGSQCDLGLVIGGALIAAATAEARRRGPSGRGFRPPAP